MRACLFLSLYGLYGWDWICDDTDALRERLGKMLRAVNEDNGSAGPAPRCPPSVRLGGLQIAQVSMDAAADSSIAHALAARDGAPRPYYSTSANGQVIAMCRADARFRALMHEADEIHADGMPMVLISRMRSTTPISERVATTDLVHAVARRAESEGVSFYFLGGSEEVNRRAVEAMRAAYPGLTFAGRRNGYFTPEEEERVVADIREARPDILWIGLGFPLEQAFVKRNLDRFTGVGVVKTAGGLFDFLSGKNARAPLWMQKAGLEWLHRMCLEPRRLARRYLVTNPVAIYALLRNSD